MNNRQRVAFAKEAKRKEEKAKGGKKSKMKPHKKGSKAKYRY